VYAMRAGISSAGRLRMAGRQTIQQRSSDKKGTDKECSPHIPEFGGSDGLTRHRVPNRHFVRDAYVERGSNVEQESRPYPKRDSPPLRAPEKYYGVRGNDELRNRLYAVLVDLNLLLILDLCVPLNAEFMLCMKTNVCK
jgi:hypothetical protein